MSHGPLASTLRHMHRATEAALPDQDVPVAALLQRIVRPGHGQPQATTVSDDMRAEVIEALGNLNHKAKREIHKVGNDVLPTPWDRRHAGLNHLLDQLDVLDEIDTVTGG